MAKMILVGDAASGKSTFLRELKKIRPDLNIFFEVGRQNIPVQIENNKFKSNLWFINYFYQRDKKALNLPNLFLERDFYFQYPFTETQFQTDLITAEQKKIIIKKMNRLTKGLPTDKDDLIIHLTCSNEIIRKRLKNRGLTKTKNKDRYWDILRAETEKYYSAKGDYFKLSASALTKKEVSEKLTKLLKSKKFL